MIEDQIFQRIYDTLTHSEDSINNVLLRAMMVYEIGDEEKPVIQARDLIRVFKRLGLSSIEPHMNLIFKAGGVKPED